MKAEPVTEENDRLLVDQDLARTFCAGRLPNPLETMAPVSVVEPARRARYLAGAVYGAARLKKRTEREQAAARRTKPAEYYRH